MVLVTPLQRDSSLNIIVVIDMSLSSPILFTVIFRQCWTSTFTARRYASAVLLSSCVCPSVCLSVTSLYRNYWTNRADIRRGGFLLPILHSVVRKIRYLQNKGRLLLSGTLSWNLDFAMHGTSIVEMCCQLSSIKLDAKRDKLVRRRTCQLSWQYLRRSTASLSHCIRQHLTAQFRRAGSSMRQLIVVYICYLPTASERQSSSACQSRPACLKGFPTIGEFPRGK